MYRAIQTLCRVKWVLSSGWRLNVMALSPGSRVFYPLMFALIRCSSRPALLRNSLVSALLNYAFSWLEYGTRVCHFWTFTLNKTDVISCMLRNPRARGRISAAAVIASFLFIIIFSWKYQNSSCFSLAGKKKRKEKTLNGKWFWMGINNTDGFWADEWRVIKLHIYMNVIVWDLRASVTA